MGKKKERDFKRKRKVIYCNSSSLISTAHRYTPTAGRYTLSLRNRCPVPLPVWHTSVVLPHAYSPVRVNQSVLHATPVFNLIALSQRQEFQKDFQAGEGREGKRECSCGLRVVENISYQ